MCGRFKLNRFQEMEDEYERLFGFTHLDFVQPPLLGEDILPFRDISVIHKSYNNVQCRPMFWNLIPSNSPRFESDFTWFNTRKEKLEQPYQKSCLQYRRCIVPVNSFMENKKIGDQPVYKSVKIDGKTVRKKESHEFRLKGQELMALGGIYDIWRGNNNEEYLYSCSIITLEPNEIIGEVHNRMPFILTPEQLQALARQTPTTMPISSWRWCSSIHRKRLSASRPSRQKFNKHRAICSFKTCVFENRT